MNTQEFILISRHRQRPFSVDVRFDPGSAAKPLILFLHGFKGFKDWGPFNLMAGRFASEGFVFAKMNFSHNGTTPERPDELVDLDAFAQNNFSIELDDAGLALDFLLDGGQGPLAESIDRSRVFIMGHSRGGTSALLKAAEDARIRAAAAWAAPNNLASWHSREEIEYWKSVGTIYVLNSRTGQQLPLHYQIVENFQANRDRLDLPAALRRIAIPVLALHGRADSSVPCQSSEQMQAWNPNVQLEILDGADHTFGAAHPWRRNELPADFEKALQHTVRFFRSAYL
jgi:uncharacterized protein